MILFRYEIFLTYGKGDTHWWKLATHFFHTQYLGHSINLLDIKRQKTDIDKGEKKNSYSRHTDKSVIEVGK